MKSGNKKNILCQSVLKIWRSIMLDKNIMDKETFMVAHFFYTSSLRPWVVNCFFFNDFDCKILIQHFFY